MSDEEQSGPTNRLDPENPKANIYGCLPCPRCGSKYRWPTGPHFKARPNCILCDECGHIEEIAK